MSTHIINPQFVKELYMGEHNLLSDEIVACLMEPAFVYDPDTHLSYSDITDSEISEGNGYLKKSKIIPGISISSSNDNILVSSSYVEWTASGGDFEPVQSICLVNISHPLERVVGCITMGSAYTTINGTGFLLNFPNGLLGSNINFY